MGGWIKLHRKITKSWIWDFDNPKMTMAWLDLLMMVNHEPRKIMVDSKPKLIGTGQTLTSMRKLAKRWVVDRQTVKRWLTTMQSDGMLTFYTTSKFTLITVENYTSYQELSTGHTTADATTDATTDTTQTRTIRIKEDEEEVTAQNRVSKFSDLLSDSDWDKLDDRYESLDSLIDMADELVTDVGSIRKPLAYICKVADAKNWPRKRKMDWVRTV